jgi:hypothetical protein
MTRVLPELIDWADVIICMDPMPVRLPEAKVGPFFSRG